AAMSEHAPTVAGENDVDAVSSEPGPFVEAVARAAGELRFRPHLENCAAGRRTPERQLELRRLVGDEGGQPPGPNGALEVETPSPWRSGNHDKSPLGAANLGPQHTVVEAVEPRAAPPPAEDRKGACTGCDQPTGPRDERDEAQQDQRGERGQPDEVRERDPETDGREQRMRRRAERCRGQGATRS